MNTRRVVITGVGALTPIGNTYGEFTNNLLLGKSGSAAITKFDTTHFKTQFACEIKGFNPSDFFDVRELRRMDVFSQYALVTAKEALTMSGIDLESVNRDRFGVIWASGNGGFKTFEEQIAEFTKNNSVPRFNPFFIPKIIADSAAGLISIQYGLRGINFCTVSACASSNHAIIDSFNYIRWGKADIMISGGSEAAVTPASVGGFNAMKALSTNNDHADTASRPFDVSRDGFVIGEGAGALILEEYEHAKRRGATILAEVVGGGMSADAYHMTATHPDGIGAVLSMRAALEDGGLTPEDIDYVNAHATSTPLGDPSEIRAIEQVFEGKKHLYVSATKSMTGHLLGAAGAVEALACVMAVNRDVIPPTINTEQVENTIPTWIDLVLTTPVEKKVRYALSNTFGFGGHNATVIVKKAEE